LKLRGIRPNELDRVRFGSEVWIRLGLCLGQVRSGLGLMSWIGSGSAWAGAHWARPGGFGFKRNWFGSRRWGPVEISRVIINGAQVS